MARLADYIDIEKQTLKARLTEGNKKMSRKLRLLLTLPLMITVLSACQPESPKTLQDCLLVGMKGVTSDVAANSIKAACMTKFPPPQPIQAALTADQLKNIGGELRPKFSSIVEGSFHNGNRDLTLITVTVRVVGFDQKTRKVVWSGEYNAELYAEPLKSSYVTIHLGQSLAGLGFDWNIVSAVGQPK